MANIKFKIIEVHPDEHSIVVRYYSDTLSEDFLATSINQDGTIDRYENGTPKRCRTDVHLNIWKTTPTVDDIKTQINHSVNYDWFELHDKIADENIDTTLEIAKPLLFKEHDVVRPEVGQFKRFSEKEIEDLISNLTETVKKTE